MKCYNCGEDVPSGSKHCPRCGAGVSESDPKAKGYLIAFIIVVVLIVMGRISSKSYKKSETRAWKEQFNKDPASWDQEEKDRYNNFMDWCDEQNEGNIIVLDNKIIGII